MKHKHADLIHQWADGAEIQYSEVNGGNWFDTDEPAWTEDVQYRIKQEEKKPVVRWLWTYQSDDTNTWHTYPQYMTEEEAQQEQCGVNEFIKLEWSRTEFPE